MVTGAKVLRNLFASLPGVRKTQAQESSSELKVQEGMLVSKPTGASKTGPKHGYQAKYFLATKEIDWSQIDKSVKTALEQNPELTNYTIAIACDLTDRSGKLGKGKTGWEHWEDHKSKWQQWAQL